MTGFASPAVTVQRDRWGRPLIIPPGGGTPVPYTRATTLAGAVDDLNGLIKWKINRAMVGIVERPDLLLAAAAHRDDEKQMYTIAEQALEAGGSTRAATIGTALHSLTERVDRGQELGVVPADYAADITAYEKAMTGYQPVHIEQMSVLDDLRVAGTPDLVVRCPDGRLRIADKKSGSISHPQKMAVQLALYAHALRYDITTGQRHPWGDDVDLDVGIIVHIPAGQGRADLYRLDLAAGWKVVPLACQVREWRKHGDLLTPVTTLPGPTAPGVAALINAATTIDQLNNLWATHQHEWNPELTFLAAARKAVITRDVTVASQAREGERA